MTDHPTGRDGLFTLPWPLGRRPELAHSYPAIEAVQAQWERLRGGRIAPGRDEIDPRPLGGALSMTFVAEFIAPGVARIRLAGQRLFDLLGMEPRGMPLTVFLAPQSRAALTDALTQLRQGARILLPLHAPVGLGRPAIEAQMLLLPLADAHGELTRIIGVLEYHGEPGRTPRPLTLSSTRPARSLTPKPSLPPVQTTQARPTPTPKTTQQPRAETSPPETATLSHRKQAARRKGAPWLRVIEGGRV